jgi:hypothetical protein
MIKVIFEVNNLQKPHLFYDAEAANETNAFEAMKTAMKGHFEYKEDPKWGSHDHEDQ